VVKGPDLVSLADIRSGPLYYDRIELPLAIDPTSRERIDGEGPPNGWKFAWWARFGLVLPELRKPSFCQRRVPGCRLQIAMTETVRQRSSVVTIIGELVSASMTQHVGMDSKGKLGGASCSLQHP
jgi:hypothetical protein